MEFKFCSKIIKSSKIRMNCISSIIKIQMFLVSFFSLLTHHYTYTEIMVTHPKHAHLPT